MRINANEFTAFGGDDNLLSWMGINEVNILSVSDDMVIFEYSMWLNGVKKWCKNMMPTAVTKSKQSQHVTFEQVKELNSTLKDIISTVNIARKDADYVSDSKKQAKALLCED